MDTLTRDTAKSYLWNQVAVVCDGVTLAVVSALVGRLAGREALGVFGWVISTAGLVALVAGLGLKEAIAVLLQRSRGDDNAVRALFARYLMLRMAAAFLAALAIAAVVWRQTGAAITAAAAAYVFVLLLSTLLSAFDVALFRTRTVAFGRIVSSVVVVSAAAVAAWRGSTAGIFWALCAGAFCAGAVYLAPLVRVAFPLKALLAARSAPAPLSTLELPLALWLVAVFNYLIGAQGAPFIARHAGLAKEEIALLTVGIGVAMISNRALMGGFANVILAAFSRAADDAESLSRLHSLYVRATAVMAAPLLAGAIAFAPLLVRIWLPGGSPEAVAVVRILAVWLLIGRLVGGGAHSAALYSSGLHRAGLAIRAAFAAVAVAATWFAAASYGATGAAAASGAVGFLVVAAEWMLLRRRRKMRLPAAALLRIAAGCALAAGAAWAVSLPGTPLAMVAAVALYACAAFVALVLARPLERGEARAIAGGGFVARLLRFLESSPGRAKDVTLLAAPRAEDAVTAESEVGDDA